MSSSVCKLTMANVSTVDSKGEDEEDERRRGKRMRARRKAQEFMVTMKGELGRTTI